MINTLAVAQNSSLNKNKTLTKSTNESIFIHLNTTSCIVGETLHCKLYCVNPATNTATKISKIAYATLIDNKNKVIFTNKIYLDEGQGQGDFFLPTTLETGNYKLVVYTNWMLNKIDLKTTTTNLLLINPYLSSNESSTPKDFVSQTKSEKTVDKETALANTVTNKTFVLKLNKNKFQQREAVLLKIKSLSSENSKGSFSISVKKIDNLPSNKQITASEFVKLNTSKELGNSINDSITSLPELRGEMISGRIINNKDPKKVSNKNVALSLPGTPFAFKIVRTNPSGRFNFILDKSPNYTNAVFQVFESDKSDYTIEIDKNSKYNFSELKTANNLYVTADNKNDIEQRSIANQIENAYFSLKKDSIVTDLNTLPFFNPLQKEYVLSDYTKFPSLKETITEVIKEMYYREKDNNYSLNLRDINYDMKYFSEPALVLVDGLLFQNVNELFTYKTENIYKVSIVPGIYFYGPKAFNGVINFVTKGNDYMSHETGGYLLKTEIQRPQNRIIAFKQDYSDKFKNKRIPDYRYQLLWQPEVTLENKENTISFYTSDVTGTFEISVEGFTEQGIPVSLRDTFEVQ